MYKIKYLIQSSVELSLLQNVQKIEIKKFKKHCDVLVLKYNYLSS